MADYVVRINRREGILEIEAPDKDWVSQQLEALAIVYERPPMEPGAAPPSVRAGESAPDGRSTAGSATARAVPRRRRAGAGRTQTRANRKPELEQKLTPDLRAALQAYVDERHSQWESKTNQAAIIATFLMDHADWGGWIDADDLYTVYSVMGWPAPANFRSQINNARQRNGYFGGWVDARVQLTHAGEQFGRHTAKDA